jgi:carboxypeptidase family protein
MARLKHRATIALMGTLLACGGHTTTTPSSSPAATTFTLSGQVTDSAARMGISDASVSITDGPDAGKWAMTDAAGNYRLAELQAAEFIVMAHAPHYVSQSKTVMLTSNQTLSFALVRTASPPHPAAPAPSALSTTGTAIKKVFADPERSHRRRIRTLRPV